MDSIVIYANGICLFHTRSQPFFGTMFDKMGNEIDPRVPGGCPRGPGGNWRSLRTAFGKIGEL